MKHLCEGLPISLPVVGAARGQRLGGVDGPMLLRHAQSLHDARPTPQPQNACLAMKVWESCKQDTDSAFLKRMQMMS